MVEQVQNWEKNVSPFDENRILGRKVQSRTLFFPWGNFPFLDLRSEGLSNLATLSGPRFARSDNRSALLDIIPSSLRSRKVKISPAERKVRPRLYSFPGNSFPSRRNIY